MLGTYGSVMVEAEGPAEALDALLTCCRTGTPVARVDQVIANASTGVGFMNFVIRR